MRSDRAMQRKAYLAELARDYNAAGVIINQMKFCEYWSYEKIIAATVLTEDHGIPTMTIERDYSLTSAGQLRTRIQAFTESLEIKEIQRGEING